MSVTSEQPKTKKVPQYVSVVNNLRSEIQSSKAGHMLPSERTLSKQYSVSHMTIRKVLDILEEEGHINRYHGRGSVIVDRLQEGEFAIVMRPLLLEAGASCYYRETARLLAEKINGYNNGWYSKLHLGEKVPTTQEFPATLDILEPRALKHLRGVFSFHPLFELRDSLKDKNVPVILFGDTGDADARIGFNRDAFLSQSAHHLRKAGCKSVGFLWARTCNLSRQEITKRCSFYSKVAMDAGLSSQAGWMSEVVGDITERKAYELFIKFLQQQEKIPDGVIIEDDIVACGVLRAVLQKNIRVPDQLRIITFSNSGLEFPYHLPVTRIEQDLSEVAKVAFETMVKLLNGMTIEKSEVYISGKFIKGQTA